MHTIINLGGEYSTLLDPKCIPCLYPYHLLGTEGGSVLLESQNFLLICCPAFISNY